MTQATSPQKATHQRYAAIRRAALEWFVIAIFGLLYCATFLAPDGLTLSGLDPNMRLQGVEHERLSGILIPIRQGLGLSERAPGIGHLPAWNPYLSTGTPLLNDAFLYLFNPFMSLPVLSTGVVQGTKIALLTGLLIAGLTMWALARAIGLGRVARVTTAGLYMMSGSIVGKIYSGHFQLGLSLAWLPLVLAGLWWTLRANHRLAPLLMAVAFALMYFCGNIYYTLHALVCCAAITAAHLISRGAQGWHFRTDRLRRVALGGLFALGLTMIQFLPVWTARDFVRHEGTAFDPASGLILSQYPLGVSHSNLVMPWGTWQLLPEVSGKLLTAVDYAYIGPTAFVLIAGLALVGLKRQRRIAGIAFGLALLMMLWGAGQTDVLNDLYLRIPLLAEFRYVGRANAVAGLWWIVLAGVALDHLWRALHSPEWANYERTRLLRGLTLALVVWGWFLYYSGANNSTRLGMALQNIGLFNWLNGLRIASFHHAADVLVGLTAVALVLDTMLMPLDLILRQREALGRVLRHLIPSRLAQIGLFMLALVGLVDVLQVNSALVTFGPPGNNFGPLYAATLGTGAAADPFPSILEPYSPSAYDAYTSRVRSWGLNEGWSPLPMPDDLIPDSAPRLKTLPQWAIVSSEFQRGGTLELARSFVETYSGVRVKCLSAIPQTGDGDPCDIDSHDGSILYQIPQALPYAFVADEATLTRQADTLTSANVQPVDAVSHQMDTIEVRASAPQDGPYYLIVQETHFPGWQAAVDGTPVEAVTVGAQAPDGAASGLIAVPMQPGTHDYRLHFEPPGFAAGLILSILTLIAMGVYLTGWRLPISGPRRIKSA